MPKTPKSPRRRPASTKRAATPAAKQSQGQVRIIAGEWRGRKLPVADLEGLRPTGDRMKETLFNWIQADIAGSRCLDLFSGSGALALEALSRGAAAACLVDQSSQVTRQLQANLATLNSRLGHVVQGNSLELLSRSDVLAPHGPYDVVFIDPPFHHGLAQASIGALIDSDKLAANSWVYVEVERELGAVTVPSHWTLHRDKTTGQVRSLLYRVSQPTA